MKQTDFNGVADSGVREEFSTGSVRDTREGKGRYDLLSPFALRRLAKHTENGAKKYGDRNWEKGQPFSRFFDSGMRHLQKYLMGLRDEDHLAAALWNFMCLAHFEELGRVDLDDMPKYVTPVPVPVVPPPPRKYGVWLHNAEEWLYDVTLDDNEAPRTFKGSRLKGVSDAVFTGTEAEAHHAAAVWTKEEPKEVTQVREITKDMIVAQ